LLNSESYLELSKASLKAISYEKEIFKRNVDHTMKGFTPVTNNTMEQNFGSSSFSMDKMIFKSRLRWFL